MSKFSPLLFFLLLPSPAHAQPKPLIYFLPGQTADHRMFDSLRIDTAYEMKFIDYKIPDKCASMRTCAASIAPMIDTSREFILVGVSLGGMLCVELSEILHPQKTIILSSAKNRGDFPFRYRFQNALPLYKLFPGVLLRTCAILLQPVVEPDGNPNRATLKSMMRAKSGTYMRQSVQMILQWERRDNSQKIYHIHGTKDRVLPLRKIRNPDCIIPGGSHIMTLTRPAEVSCTLNRLLCEGQ